MMIFLLLLQDPAEIVATLPKPGPTTAAYEGVATFFVMHTAVHLPVDMTFRVKPGEARRADVAFYAPTGAARAAWVDAAASFQRWTYINDKIEDTSLPGPLLENVRQPIGEKRPPWWAVTPDFAIQLLLDSPLVSFSLDPSLILREPNLASLGGGVLESTFELDALSRKSLLYLLPIDRVRCRFFIDAGRLRRWEFHADGAEIGDGLWQWYEVVERDGDVPSMIVGGSHFRVRGVTFGVTHLQWLRSRSAGDPGGLATEAIWRDAATPGLVSERVDGASKADEAYRRVMAAMKAGIVPGLVTGRFSLEMSPDLLDKLAAEKPDSLVAAVNLADASKFAGKPGDPIAALILADLHNRAGAHDKAAAALDGVAIPPVYRAWGAGARLVAAAGLGRNEEARKAVTDYLSEACEDEVPESRFWKIAGSVGSATLAEWAAWLGANADSPWAHGVRALAAVRPGTPADIDPFLEAVKGGKLDARKVVPFGMAIHAAGRELASDDEVDALIEATGEPAVQDAWIHAAALNMLGEAGRPHAAKAWELLKPRIEAGRKTPADVLTLAHLAHHCYSQAANDEFCALAQTCIEKDYLLELLVNYAQAGSKNALGILTGHLARRGHWREAARVLALVRRHRPDAFDRHVSRANDSYAGGLIDVRKEIVASGAAFSEEEALAVYAACGEEARPLAEKFLAACGDPSLNPDAKIESSWGPRELAAAVTRAKDPAAIVAHPRATFGIKAAAAVRSAQLLEKEGRPVEALFALQLETKKLRYAAFVGGTIGLVEGYRTRLLNETSDEALAAGLAARAAPLTDEEAAAVEEHIRALGADDVGKRDEATSALKAFGPRAAAKLAPHVTSADPEVLARVREILRSYVVPGK